MLICVKNAICLPDWVTTAQFDGTMIDQCMRKSESSKAVGRFCNKF